MNAAVTGIRAACLCWMCHNEQGTADLHLARLTLLGTMPLQDIEKEYLELDTVWFMAGSLFNQFPYDIPTEAFGRGLFLQVRQGCFNIWRHAHEQAMTAPCQAITAAVFATSRSGHLCIMLHQGRTDADGPMRAGICSSAGQHCAPARRGTRKAFCVDTARATSALLLPHFKGGLAIAHFMDV